MGANIYPEDVETAIYRDPAIVRRLRSFLLSVVDDASGTPRPAIALELSDLSDVDEAWRERCSDRLRAELAVLNADYRASVAEFPEAMRPIVRAYAPGEGPFAGDGHRIKQRRIAHDGP